MNQTPTIGRIVFFVLVEESPEGHNHSNVVPGIITRVINDTLINITVFTDGPENMWKEGVNYAPGEDQVQFSWHWPPRV